MKILYYIYQICIALPILLVLTILTAIVTIVGSLLGGAHIWGYYPGKIWSQLICLFLLIPVKIEGREKLHDKTSYIFVPNHQGSFDIFLIYGFIGRNFKWMIRLPSPSPTARALRWTSTCRRSARRSSSRSKRRWNSPNESRRETRKPWRN